jgi:hypothetical protein
VEALASMLELIISAKRSTQYSNTQRQWPRSLNINGFALVLNHLACMRGGV